MTILELILVFSIPLASFYLSTISIQGIAFILFLLCLSSQLEILGELFQISYYFIQDSNILLSFFSILVNPLRKENISSNNNISDQANSPKGESYNNKDLDITFKTWLISNTPAKEYLNAKDLKSLIYKENTKCTGIYLWLNNINGKYYIGSANDLRNRLARYYSPKELATANNLIHKAIIKHKHENFSLYVLEYCDLSILIAREQFYIDSLTPPYNILKVAGSSTGFKHSEETKNLMREKKINDPNLLERIKKLSAINKGNTKSAEFKALRSFLTKGEKNPMFGKTHTSEVRAIMNLKKRGISLSEDHKAKIRESLAKLGPIDTKSAKVVYLYSHDNPTVLYKEFQTYTKAAFYLGCHRRTIYRYIDSEKLYLDKWLISSKLMP